jgi:nucleoside-diphosphate kinase
MPRKLPGRQAKGRSNPHETFILLKPDGTKRQLLVELLLRLKIHRLRVLSLKTVQLTASCVTLLYGQYRRQPYYQDLKRFMRSGDCIAIRVAGRNAISRVRKMIGVGGFPYPKRTFRGTYATTQRRNVVHASDSAETAKKELGHFF